PTRPHSSAAHTPRKTFNEDRYDSIVRCFFAECHAHGFAWACECQHIIATLEPFAVLVAAARLVDVRWPLRLTHHSARSSKNHVDPPHGMPSGLPTSACLLAKGGGFLFSRDEIVAGKASGTG